MNPFKLHTPFILLFFFSSFHASADNQADSLYQLVKKSRSPDQKLERYLGLMEHLGENLDTQLVAIADEVIAFSEKENLPAGVAHAHKNRGNLYLKKGRQEEAMQELLTAEEIFKKNGDTSEQVYTMLMLQLLHRRNGDKKRQFEIIDEAVELAKSSGDDLALAAAYEEKGKAISFSKDPSKTLEYYNLALEKLTGKDAELLRAKTLVAKGIFLNRSDTEAAYPILLEAQAIGKKLGNHHFLLFVNQNLFSVLNTRNELTQAMELAFENYKIAEQLDDFSEQSSALKDVGRIYLKLGNVEEATSYFTQAIALAEKGHVAIDKVVAEYEMGITYLNSGDFEKALFYYQEALQGLIKLNRQNNIPGAMASIGYCHLELGQLEKAHEYFNKVANDPNVKNQEGLHKALVGLGIYYYRKNNYLESIRYNEKVYDYAAEAGKNYLADNASEYLYQANKALSKPAEALQWLEIHKELQDSTLNQENIAKMTSLKLNAQFEKEKEKIALEQEQQEVLLRAEVKQSRTVAVAIGALAVIGLGFFWNLRRKNRLISEQNRQLEHLNQTKDRLFSIIGHDLRKPALGFRGIAKKVNYLLQKKDFKTLERLGTEIEKDALSLNRLTDNLLNWALTQKEVMPYQPQAIPVAEIVEEELAVFQNVAAAKKVELVSEIPPGLKAYADVNSLHTIIRNLLDNALKFSSAGGKVQIIAETDNRGVSIKVEDNGTGIPDDKLKNIFLLQKGKSQAGTAGEKGTGLGLHLVNELVKLNQGAIEVASQIGQGTKFSLFLPVSARA